MQLRDYQATATSKLQDAYRGGFRAPLLCMPTGAGKSAMVTHMMQRTPKRTLILAHRENLVDMISADLGVPHGVITAGRRVSSDRIQVGMMQTVVRRLGELGRFDWVISDEAHLALCESWLRILKHYKDAWHLGMSATPCRLDGKGLGLHFDKIVFGPSPKELIARGFLVPIRVYVPPGEGLDLPNRKAADRSLLRSAEFLDRPTITGNAVAHVRRLGPGHRTLVFCCTREHAEHVAAEFRLAGFRAANVDGGMPRPEQKRLIDQFKAGALELLVNVDLLTTGFDCPPIDVISMLRLTDSLSLFLQMIGRETRPAPGKREAILLDHVGNVVRHGMPDADREWELDGREKRPATPAIRQCPECYAAFAPAPKCPHCGHVFAAGPVQRRPPKQAEGSLVEVKDGDGTSRQIAGARRPKATREQINRLLHGATSLADFQLIAAELGYKHSWASVQWHLHRRRRQRHAA